MFINRIFPRTTHRPTPDERQVLTLLALERGACSARLYRRLIRWAAEPDNAEMLDLVLAGEVEVLETANGLLLRSRDVPEWMREPELAEAMR